jgi:hypothetical protein
MQVFEVYKITCLTAVSDVQIYPLQKTPYMNEVDQILAYFGQLPILRTMVHCYG